MFGKKETEQKTKHEKEETVTVIKDTGDNTAVPEPAVADAGSALNRSKKKSKKKKRIISAVVVLAVIAVAVKMFAGGGTPVIPTATVEIARMDIQQIISIKGTVEGNDRAEVTSSENREIASISVKEGDVVTKGQLLATLKEKEETNNGEKYQRQQAQNNLESARFDFNTSKQLYAEGAMSQQDYLKSEIAYKNAQSVLAVINDKSTTENKITSPIDGVITRVNAKVGFTPNQMQNGTALFAIEDLSSLKMQVKVSEYNISNIRVGQTVTISAEVLGRETVSGVVSHIAPTGELKDASGKEMVIPVKIDILKNDKNLIAGVTAKADILVEEQKDVISIPIDSMLTDPVTGEKYVFVVAEDNVLSKKVITTGLESDFFIEITSDNIKEGDTIVATPAAEMTDGQVIVTESAAAGGDGAPDGAVTE